MRTAAAASAALATGQAILVDLVTLTIPRSWYLADGTLVSAPAVARWTSHDRALRYGGNTFRGLSGTVWTRGKRTDTTGQELPQFEGTLAGSLLVDWRTHPTDAAQVDQIELYELAMLGLLDSATIQVDVAVLSAWPTSPEASLAADAVLPADVVVLVQSADRSGWTTTFKGLAPPSVGNASVPRAVVSPFCRWEFGSVECMGDAVPRPLESATIVGIEGERLVLSTTLSEWMDRWPVLMPMVGRNMGIPRLIGEKVASGANWSYRLSEQFPWTQGSGTAVVLKKCSRMWSSSPSGIDGGSDWGCIQSGNGPRFGGFPRVPASEDV